MQCGIDCDGGIFLMRPSGGSLLIENQGFVVVGGCGASDEDNENPVVVRPGADDKTFRLDKQPLDQCTALREAHAAGLDQARHAATRTLRQGRRAVPRPRIRRRASGVAPAADRQAHRGVQDRRRRQAARAAAIQSGVPRRTEERPQARRHDQLLAGGLYLRLHAQRRLRHGKELLPDADRATARCCATARAASPPCSRASSAATTACSGSAPRRRAPAILDRQRRHVVS